MSDHWAQTVTALVFTEVILVEVVIQAMITVEEREIRVVFSAAEVADVELGRGLVEWCATLVIARAWTRWSKGCTSSLGVFRSSDPRTAGAVDTL